MKHFELHDHYLRQLVYENVVSLEYCRTNDQIIDIFIKPFYEARFFKLHRTLGIHEVAIMGGCHAHVISPLESLESCVYGRVLKHQFMMVHDTSLEINQ